MSEESVNVETSNPAVTVERLYEICELLDSDPTKTANHESEFKEMLNGVKGEKKQKQLACQFIMRFFKHFPGLLELTLDAHFDLCEDEDASIRRQAIKELPNFCREVQSTVERISDILAQLLQAEDTIEYAVVQTALLNVLKVDPVKCLNNLFVQIATAPETGGEIIRERTIKFLATKVPSLGAEVLTPDIETILIDKIQNVMSDCTCQEFNTLVKILSSLKQMQQFEGRSRLISIISKQAGIDEDQSQEFDPANEERVIVLVQCTKQAMDFFSRNCPSTPFVKYFCTDVLPRLWDLPANSQPGESKVSQLDVLKLLAELSSNCGPVDACCVEHTYNALTSLLPELPKPSTDADGKPEKKEFPNLQLSHLECLLYTFHSLAKQPSFQLSEQYKESLKQLRPTLQYTSNGLQQYINKLRADVAEKTQEELKEEENQIKNHALKVTLNINLLVKDLTRTPPSYETAVTLSWKRAVTTQNTKAQNKRRWGGGGGGGSHQDEASSSKGNNRGVYNPPSGKYSKQVNSYDTQYRPGFKGNKFKLGVYYA